MAKLPPNQAYRLLNPVRKKAPPRPPSGGGGGRVNPPPLTIEEWARQQAEQTLAGQRAAIEEQRKVYLDELRRQAEMEAERGRQLAQALQGMNFPGAIQDIYSAAGSDISGMAKGFSTEMQGAAAADAATQRQMLSGTGQEGAVRDQGAVMGDVLFGSQGYIPGKTMAETGAAFASDAALQPAFAARFGQEGALKLHEEGMSGLGDFSIQLAELAATKPGVVQDYIKLRQGYQNDRLDAQNTAADNNRAERAQQIQRGYLLLSMARSLEQKAKAYTDIYGTIHVVRNGKIVNTGRPVIGNYVDPVTGAPLKGGTFFNPKTGRVEDIPTPKSPKDQKDKWEKPAKVRQAIARDADDLFETVETKDFYGTKTEKVPWAYQRAFNFLLAKYRGSRPPKQLRQWINEILRANGIKPGTTGSSDLPSGTTGSK